jgi:2-oxo-4-hydroxy-4-carboxy-5-ureidoimidazoline decarboxylase
MQSPHCSSVDAVNRLQRDAFVSLLGGVFEDSRWVAERAWAQRPFADVEALHAALVEVVAAAGEPAQLALIRAHPDLAGRAAIAEQLTAESAREQSAAGLDRLTPEQFERLTALNAQYTARFGFPFVICARAHDAASIIAAAGERLTHDADTERQTALGEIAQIARLRLYDVVADHEDAA